MSFMQIEYATAIYENKLREAEHYRLVKKALAGRQKQARNPILALGQLVSRLVKKRKEHSVAVEQTSAVLTNAGS